MKINSNRLWYIFFITWEVGKRKKVLEFFHALAKIWPSLCYGTKRMRMNFIGLMRNLLQKLPEK